MLPLEYIAFLLLLLISGGFGLRYYRKLTSPYRYLIHLIFFTIAVEVANIVMSIKFKFSYPAYHVFYFISVIYYSLIYKSLLKTARVHIYTGAFICFLVAIYSFIEKGDFMFFPSNGLISLSFFIITLVLRLFWNMIHAPQVESILKQPAFWFNSGSFAFYTITFFIFGFLNYIITEKASNISFIGYAIIRYCNFVLFISYFVTLILAVKKSAHDR